MSQCITAKARLCADAYAAYCAERKRVGRARYHAHKNRVTKGWAATIYALRDPTTADPYGHPQGAVFYIGQTIKPRKRFCEHGSTSSRATYTEVKKQTIQAIIAKGQYFHMELLNRVRLTEDTLEAEELWIHYCLSLGYQLTNRAIGKLRCDFSYCLEFDGKTEQSTLAVLADCAQTIMLQCLACHTIMWRDANQLIEAGLSPATTLTQYRCLQHCCESCGGGAITTCVEEMGKGA